MVATTFKPEYGQPALLPGAEKQRPKRLDSLTSLRFFAAVGVIYVHLEGVLSICEGAGKVELSHVLSWFFILSGFILTYMYPRLNSWSDTVRFFRARIGRVYPGHVFALTVPFALALTPQMSLAELSKLLLANLLLVQSWIPQSYWYYSINPPAWSVSTEFFFYLMFPFLIPNIERTWPIKLLGSFLLVVSFVLVAAHFNLPDRGGPFDITTFSVIYVNPLTRIFEFVLGMSAAVLWKRLSERTISAPIAFAGELAFLALACIYMCNVNTWFAPHASQTGIVRAINTWLLYSGNCFFFAGMIACFALQTGYLSRLLSNKFFVALGELSFSMYLLHIFGRNYFVKFHSQLGVLNEWFCLGIYFMILMVASHLLYEFLEMPLRVLISGTKKKVVTATKMADLQPDRAKRWKIIVAIGEVALLAVTFIGIKYQIKSQNHLHSQHVQQSQL